MSTARKRTTAVPSQETVKGPSNDNEADNNQSPETKKGVPPKQKSSLNKNRIYTRMVIVLTVFTIVYFTSSKEKERKFAQYKENIPLRSQNVECSLSYLNDVINYPGCAPVACGRFVSDVLVTDHEASILLQIAKTGMALAGSSGGASILDLHSGALSKGSEFTNVHQHEAADTIFTKDNILAYRMVKSKIQHAIAEKFKIDETTIYLTHPTFFSRITNVTSKTPHDEYWHKHIDKDTYESFFYTSLVYLSNFGKDFEGGRFVFVDGLENNRTISTIEPKRGRVSAFTSGAENEHYIEKVTSGERFAITISFTCNKEFAIDDPVVRERSGF